MMERSLGAACGKSLIEKVPGHKDIHLSQFLSFLFVCAFLIGGGQVKHVVVEVTQQLAVLFEGSGSIRYAQIDESLTVSCEKNRFACYRSVRVLGYVVAFEHSAKRVCTYGLGRGHQLHESLRNGLHVSNLIIFQLGERYVQFKIPTVV